LDLRKPLINVESARRAAFEMGQPQRRNDGAVESY